MDLDVSAIRELLVAFNQTDISELILKSGELEFTLRRGMPIQLSPTDASTLGSAGVEFVDAARKPLRQDTESTGSEPIHSPMVAVPSSGIHNWEEVRSPMVGTFYRAPAPDEPSFVEVGDRIRAGQPLCIIEAMKTMNELEAEVAGEVIEILVGNGEPVEYNQPLMRIKPERAS